MRTSHWGRWVCLAALLLLGATAAWTDEAKDDKVELKVAKYADFEKLIGQLKGKVVVADFWQDT